MFLIIHKCKYIIIKDSRLVITIIVFMSTTVYYGHWISLLIFKDFNYNIIVRIQGKNKYYSYG